MKLKISVAVACVLPCRAKDLSAPLQFTDFPKLYNRF